MILDEFTDVTRKHFMVRRGVPLLAVWLIAHATIAVAQLPPDAVMLDKVKIPEKQKSIDLCPVHLEPSDAKLATWEYRGVKYRGSKPDAKDQFFKDPDKYAKAAEKQRPSSTTSCKP